MDFKKTLLWAVFSMAGLLLYNNWQVYEGKPSMFGGAPTGNISAGNKTIETKLDVPAPIQGEAFLRSHKHPQSIQAL